MKSPFHFIFGWTYITKNCLISLLCCSILFKPAEPHFQTMIPFKPSIFNEKDNQRQIFRQVIYKISTVSVNSSLCFYRDSIFGHIPNQNVSKSGIFPSSSGCIFQNPFRGGKSPVYLCQDNRNPLAYELCDLNHKTFRVHPHPFSQAVTA